jgi:hypothetical protein
VIVPGSGVRVGPTSPSIVNVTVPMTWSKPLELLLSTGNGKGTVKSPRLLVSKEASQPPWVSPPGRSLTEQPVSVKGPIDPSPSVDNRSVNS